MRYGQQEVQERARELLKGLAPSDAGATVVGLSGDLGAGKTTLVQAVAQELGIAGDVQSPTFVVMKSYVPPAGPFEKLVHVDAYRIESLDELAPLRFAEVLAAPRTLVVVEWPERIAPALPANMHAYAIDHDGDHRILRHA